MNEPVKMGFTYLIEVVHDGEVVDSEVVHNLVPTEGLNHTLDVLLRGGTQVTQWYVGVFENDYTPLGTDVMSTFASLAGESTAYTDTTRLEFTPGAPAGGVANNSAALAEFTFNATKTIRGAFLSSSNTKGGTAGVLLSAAKFSAAKSVTSGDILRVSAGIQMTSS